jgi:hypothetical protein
MAIRVRHNASVIQRQLAKSEGATRAAMRRTINKMVRAVRTLTLRRLSEETGLTQKRLREYVSENRADYASLVGSVCVRPHTFNIASFPGVRQIKRRKTVSLGRKGERTRSSTLIGGVVSPAWGVRKLYPSAFLIQGGKTAMVRVGKARYPIRPVYGPRIHAEFVKIDDELKLEVQARFAPTLRHELNFALGRIGLKV